MKFMLEYRTFRRCSRYYMYYTKAAEWREDISHDEVAVTWM